MGKVNITYILGNGFDIQCGLATKYSDFLKEYTVIQYDDNENIIEFKKYLSKSENQELWSDAEKAMGVHLGDFSDETVGNFTERIVDFCTKMMEYLEKQQARCSWSKTLDINRIFLSFLFKSFDDIVPLNNESINVHTAEEDNYYQFIVFNYTKVIDEIIKCCAIENGGIAPLRHRALGQRLFSDTIGKIYHVHGDLDSSIIMGVNDPDQLATNQGLQLTSQLRRQLIKPMMNQALNHSWDLPAKIAIRESDIIVIYGVSFGETDNVWWDEIRAWLEKSKEHKLVVFIRNDKYISKFRLVWQIVEFENEEIPKILYKLRCRRGERSYIQLRRQVYAIPNTRRLDLKSIILGDGASDSPEDKVALTK